MRPNTPAKIGACPARGSNGGSGRVTCIASIFPAKIDGWLVHSRTNARQDGPGRLETEQLTIGQHGVSAHTNGKDLGQLDDPGSDPVSPMGKLTPGLDINATKQLAPNAPGDDVVMRSGVQREQLTAGHRHGGAAHFGLDNHPTGRATDGL